MPSIPSILPPLVKTTATAMKAFPSCSLALLSLLLASSTFGQALPHLFESDGSGPPNKLYWQTEPGVRYDLWKSDNLSSWQRVTGYPAVAEGLAMEHAITPEPGGKGFFKMIPIDEQPPVVVAQYPAVEGFAVGRFADLNIELWDATGINPASIRLTVGGTGPLAPGAPGLVVSGNTVTYDSGDAALGAWGATVTATLVAVDTLGHTLTHTWSFRLEPEPQTAANVFVFGSPTAQRAGQRISGPAAALAARFPAPAGPQKAVEPPPWSIHEVLADRIVIAYQAGGAPIFTAGQLVCNLAPASESQIFYRRVLSTSDDPVNLKLTVFTEESELTDFATQGSVSFSDDSVVYETAPDGSLVRALSKEITFPRTGYDLSGTSFELSVDGFTTEVPGLPTQQQGTFAGFLSASAPEWYWWFTPRLRVGLETRFGQLKSFEAIASGQLSQALEVQVAAGISVEFEKTIFDLPEAVEPKTVVYLGAIGVIPVFGTLGFDFSIKAKAKAEAALQFSTAYRQEIYASLGVSYDDGSGLSLVRSFQTSAPDIDPPSIAPTNELEFKLVLDPRIEFLVYGLAGMKASIEPFGALHVISTTPPATTSSLEVGLDFTLGTAGPGFEKLGIEAELSLPIWSNTWQLSGTTLAFKNQPQGQTVAPGDDVSFTCSVDSASAPSFQWHHKGVPIPGQTSRSLFLAYVNAGHAGSYFVRAKADGQTVDSNTATLTVQAVTPETLDSDNDGIPNIYETNTGTWVSATNTGTNPYKWDTDGDGLSDKVETRTFTYASRTNTGTDPNLPDTDADGMADKTEIDQGRDPNRGNGPVATLQKLASGFNHSLFVKTGGTLWAMGGNSSGQLGDGTTVSRFAPIQVASGVAQVTAGFDHSLFVKTDGTLWAMGSNSSGQLGDGTTVSRFAPLQVASGVAQVTAGLFHSLFVKTDGTLWAMGGNSSGQLGDGTTVSRFTPIQVASGVAQVTAGFFHSLFVKTDGTLWAMGSNSSGQLGDGTTVSRFAPLQVASGVAQVTAGHGYSLFVKTDGTLWAMGGNHSGQLGDGTTVSRFTPIQVASGVRFVESGEDPLVPSGHTLFSKTNNTIWGMGSNTAGALGIDPSVLSRSLNPVQIATGF